MTLEACYGEMGGDLSAALCVLESETRLKRYLIRFLDEPTARMLLLALEDARWEDAARAAHTMKGLCRGLGLTPLQENKLPEDVQIAGRVKAEYERVVRAIRALESGR